jgi:hypothetical protein
MILDFSFAPYLVREYREGDTYVMVLHGISYM